MSLSKALGIRFFVLVGIARGTVRFGVPAGGLGSSSQGQGDARRGISSSCCSTTPFQLALAVFLMPAWFISSLSWCFPSEGFNLFIVK